MEKQGEKCGQVVEISEDKFYSTEIILCDDCLEKIAQDNYHEEVRWQENMNNCYEWDEGGFCDGFARY